VGEQLWPIAPPPPPVLRCVYPTLLLLRLYSINISFRSQRNVMGVVITYCRKQLRRQIQQLQADYGQSFKDISTLNAFLLFQLKFIEIYARINILYNDKASFLNILGVVFHQISAPSMFPRAPSTKVQLRQLDLRKADHKEEVSRRFPHDTSRCCRGGFRTAAHSTVKEVSARHPSVLSKRFPHSIPQHSGVTL